MPFDFVKIQTQRKGYLNEYTYIILIKAYSEHGWKKLYIGWQFRLDQYTVQAILTCTALENLEIKRKSRMRLMDENGINK